jgi:hypothetical protein
MSYLDWKGAPVLPPHHQQQSPSQSIVTLSLTGVLLQELAKSLEDVYMQGGTELRIALPNQWLFFWKLREEGNRILLAHPNEKEWVGTFAFEKELGEKLVLSLKNLAQGQSLSLSELGSMSPVSNLDLSLVFKGSD